MKISFRKKQKFSVNCQPNAQSGFSMLELIVAMVLFLIITGSIYGLLQVGRVDRNRASRRTDIMKNARTAVHLIGRDALNAGLGYHQSGALVPDGFVSSTLGIPADNDNKRDVLYAIITGNNINTNDLQENQNTKTDIVSFAYRDLDYNCGSPLTLTGVTSISGGTAARVTFTPPVPPPSCTSPPPNQNPVSKYDLFLVESDSTQLAGMATNKGNYRIDFAPGDPLGMNQAYNSTGENASLFKSITYSTTSAKKFYWVSYKVKQDGTLVRITYGNNSSGTPAEQIQEQPLAYNIKDMQFRYVLNNGTVTEDPIAGDDGILGNADDDYNNLALITQITVTLKVASTESDEQMGKPDVITVTATFSTRNLQYDVG